MFSKIPSWCGGIEKASSSPQHKIHPGWSNLPGSCLFKKLLYPVLFYRPHFDKLHLSQEYHLSVGAAETVFFATFGCDGEGNQRDRCFDASLGSFPSFMHDCNPVLPLEFAEALQNRWCQQSSSVSLCSTFLHTVANCMPKRLRLNEIEISFQRPLLTMYFQSGKVMFYKRVNFVG